jgi:hypothetical protein
LEKYGDDFQLWKHINEKECTEYLSIGTLKKLYSIICKEKLDDTTLNKKLYCKKINKCSNLKS